MFSIITNNKFPTDEVYFEFNTEIMDKEAHKWAVTGGGYHRNPNFNKLAYQLFNIHPLFILDIGCGGGNFIEDCIKDGHYAIGIDGLYLYSKLGLNSWGKYPNNYFNVDIGRHFQILYNNQNILFDIITSWECFEHIKTVDVPQMINNIVKHIKIGGYCIFSTSINDEVNHRTRRDKKWWIDQFCLQGFIDTDINFYPNVIRDCPGSSYYCLQYKGNNENCH